MMVRNPEQERERERAEEETFFSMLRSFFFNSVTSFVRVLTEQVILWRGTKASFKPPQLQAP